MDPRRVLLVEDDLFLAKIFEQRLREAGFEVAYAGDGEAALRDVASKRPDAIILAIALPKKDGFEVLESLQQNALLRSIPVMMLTKAGAKEDVDRCLAAGACEYFIKSQHTPDDVVRRLNARIGME